MQFTPVGIIMAQIKQLQGRTLEKLLKNSDIGQFVNSAQVNIIYQLWQEDNITISTLSKRTQLANTTLTTMLDRLEGQGQITRCRSTANRREVRIQLTNKSRNIEDQVSTLLHTMHSINFKDFTPEEEAQLYHYLDRIKTNLEHYEHKENILLS